MAEPISGVNPAVLVWARERSGLTIEEVADAIGKSAAAIHEWETGGSVPTYVQLEKLAYAVYKRPLALFFFPKPPEEPDPHHSFRTLPDFEIEELSSESRYRIRQAHAVQSSLQELADGKNPAVRFILRDLPDVGPQSPTQAARQVREYLGITIEEQKSWNSKDQALGVWRSAVENVGVFVFKDTFKQRDVSGFSLYHSEFPVIYVNNSTAKSRQMFTLFHELAHLLVRTNGITKRDDSYIQKLHGVDHQIEVFCNRFAAEILVPDQALKTEDLHVDDHNIGRLAKVFKVSREVILRRFLDRGLVSSSYYEKKAKEWAADYFDHKQEESGGNYYATLASYLSDTFTRLAFRRYYQGSLRIEELAQHLNVKIANVSAFEQAVLQKVG
jgi:Zn-dependent peptidase ImmA (M78 family)/DNA-binding XRE family transcriptional regulator